MKKKLTVMAVALAIALVCVPATALASSKAKMTTYDGAVKSGNTVYCASPGWGIYKATVKNGKVVKKKWLLKETVGWGAGSDIGHMKKKGNYLYFIEYTEGTVTHLVRLNVKNGKCKTIAHNVTAYAIKGKKIYAQITNPDTLKKSYRVMKLNGKSKKKTSVRPVMKTEYSHKGYSTSYKEKGKYIRTYLKTPKGKYYIGKVRSMDSFDYDY